jgi:hypothetical protein
MICTTLSGCATLGPKTVITPISGADFDVLKKGVEYTPQQDGYFLSKFFMSEVEKTQVNNAHKAT